MIYHVTRDGSHHVVTVNAHTAQDAARIAVIHRRFPNWEGVPLQVIQPLSTEAKTVVVGSIPQAAA